jgi:DNA (cytosine-5)-methyltransferase 1
MDHTLDQLQMLCGQLGIPLPVQQPATVLPPVASSWNGKAPIALSFCSGAMGLDLGLERAGFKVVVASETDPDARATIAANRPGLPVLGDLREYTAAQVRAAVGIGEDTDIDLVAAGVPCQSFSTAGKQGGTSDERGRLLLEFVGLAVTLKPKYVVIENVPGLVRDKDAFDQVLKTLRDGGYAVSFNLYDAACFGAAQRRERVIVIASRTGRVPHLAPTHSNRPEDGLPPWRTLRDAIGDMRRREHHHAKFPERRLRFFQKLKPGQNWRDLSEEDQTKAISEATRTASGGKSGLYRRLAWDELAMTLLTHPCNFLSGCCHPDEDRPLSVEEYKRLQGFPDGWKVCGNLQSQYRQIGNAVPVPLGEAVGRAIVEHMSTGRSEDPVPSFRYSRYRNTSDRNRNKLQPKERISIMDNTLDTLGQLKTLCGHLGVPLPPPPLPKPPVPEPVLSPPPEPVLYQPFPGIDCWQCKFDQLPLEDGTADYICTDIPWADDWLKHVEKFSQWCSRKLRPGGIVTTLCTAHNLDRLLVALTTHLEFVWLCCSPLQGCVQSRSPFLLRCCTLCVVLSDVKKPFFPYAPQDLLPTAWLKEKDEAKRWHEHGQSPAVVQYLVEHCSERGALVVDPCSGGWSTMEACWRTGRRFIGSDDRPDCLDKARGRFAAMQAEVPDLNDMVDYENDS